MLRKLQQKEKKKNGIFVFLGILILLVFISLILLIVFHVQDIDIEGNERYTKEEIEKRVIKQPYEKNSLYLYWKYKTGRIGDIPFINSLDIEIIKPDRIKITVYEKNIVGYFTYLNTYLYFDKDGVIVESSDELAENIPEITGLGFDHFVLHEKLPVEDTKIFHNILALTQTLKKTEMVPDRIYFDQSGEMTLFFDQAKILLGTEENMNEKIGNLKGILPSLQGLTGSLDLKNVTKDTNQISFSRE